MKTLAELSSKSGTVSTIKKSKINPLSMHIEENQYIEPYELYDSRIKPFYLVDENKWEVNLPGIDEDDSKNFAAGAIKIFAGGKLLHYEYVYRLNNILFHPYTLIEEAKFKESGECIAYEDI